MPSIATPLRQAPSLNSYSTPGRLNRPLSPPVSTSSHSTPTITPFGAQQKSNLVTRLAIEGKAKQDEDSVSIKMYLKISLPPDSLAPGSTVQLFPEEHVKILSSQVHPLDSDSVPYFFDSTVSPLLNRAAHALKLPERSKQSFQSAFGLSSVDSSSVVDTNYTGHILVSGYHISYVLPKLLPSEGKSSSISRRRASIGERYHVHFMAAIDLLVPYLSHPPRSPYLLSIPTPRCLHNNISLRIFPPTSTNVSSSFASLSSLSTDNEDSNNSGTWDLASNPLVTRTATSKFSSRSRANSYNSNNNFADDESSDSSTVGFSYGCGIRGMFPSTERIRVRWAKPMKSFDTDESGEGRRRVGVKDVKGEITCVVRGRVKDGNGSGVLMDVSYRGTCKGLWYPGVATLLGMDVGLVAKNSDVSWAEGFPNEWEVSGGTGYTGFDVGLNQRLFRHDSLEPNSNSANIEITPSSPNGDAEVGLAPPRPSGFSSRQNSTSSTVSAASSTSSLLRAPLPTQNVAEYSFEGLPHAVSTPVSAFGSPSASGGLSSSHVHSNESESLSSLPASASVSMTNSDLTQSHSQPNRAPEHPITLHIDVDKLLPASKNHFIFSISGTVVVKPRSTNSRVNGHAHDRGTSNSTGSEGGEGSDRDSPKDMSSLITIPFFTVHAADSESCSVVVKNGLIGAGINVGGAVGSEGGIVEVFNEDSSVSASVSSSSKSLSLSNRRFGPSQQLQKGAMAKFSRDSGVRIALKDVHVSSPNVNGATPMAKQQNERATLRPPARPLTPSGSTGSRSSSPRNNSRIARTSSLSALTRLPPGTTLATKPARDGPLMIPWVNATVTPLVPVSSAAKPNTHYSDLPESYAVRMCLPAPSSDVDKDEDGNGGWLEFGLAKPAAGLSGSGSAIDARPPNVDLVNVSVEGVPVRFEVTAATAASSSPSTQEMDTQKSIDLGLGLGGVQFGEMSGKEWISWIRVNVAGARGGMVVVDYVVRAGDDWSEDKEGKAGSDEKDQGKRKGKRKARDEVPMDIYLPSFALPVGRLELVVEDTPGLELSSLRTNLHYSDSPIPTTKMTRQRLLHYSTEEFFYPHLSFLIRIDKSFSSKNKNSSSSHSKTATSISLLNLLAISLAILFLTQVRWKVYHLGKSLENLSFLVGSGWNDFPEPITVTETVYSSAGPRWWLGGESSSSGATASSTSDESFHQDMSITSPDVRAPSQSSTTIPNPFPSATESSSHSHSHQRSQSHSHLPTHDDSDDSDSETALIPFQSIWNFQWQDFTPLAQSTAEIIKRTLRPVMRILSVIWWGPDD